MNVWPALESNPDVLTKYIYELGVSKSWVISDVVGLEPEMLEWIPKPVKSIILLFPCSPKYEEHRTKQHEELSANPQKYPDDLFYMRQFTHNACGTVAIIHSVANAKGIEMNDGILKNFLEQAKTMTPEERGEALEKNTEFTSSHDALAQEGQTVVNQDKVYHHFISFVNHNDTLYELDGRKSFPINHGATSSETFVADAAKICKEFMARDPEEVRFTVLALNSAQ